MFVTAPEILPSAVFAAPPMLAANRTAGREFSSSAGAVKKAARKLDLEKEPKKDE